MMNKDSDFLNPLNRHGPPPPVSWVTCGNTFNQRMRPILRQTLQPAVEMLKGSETMMETLEL